MCAKVWGWSGKCTIWENQGAKVGVPGYLSRFGVGRNSGASDMNGTATRLKSRVWGFRKGVACLGSSQDRSCSPADSLPGKLGTPLEVAGRRRDLGGRGCEIFCF